MMRRLLLWASRSRWMRDRFSRAAFVRRAVSRFMPGETAEAALEAAAAFHRRGIGTVLTLLGENVANPGEAGEVVAHYKGVLDAIRPRGVDAEISVKLTHLGLDLDRELACSNLRAIAAAAAARRMTVWVDMEGSAYTQVTLDLFRRVRAGFANVGICLQAYLYRTAEDLEALAAEGAAIRLVKGAYAEPARVAFPRKSQVDESFLALARRLLGPDHAGRGARVAIGTHDLRLIRTIEREAAQAPGKHPVEFQMLYGIQRDEQERLVAAGHRVRVLISYGAAWFPWYLRRIAERPANLWFVARNLFRR
jgi:proline dehydrogenase